jgi:hypothetical protein
MAGQVGLEVILPPKVLQHRQGPKASGLPCRADLFGVLVGAAKVDPVARVVLIADADHHGGGNSAIGDLGSL